MINFSLLGEHSVDQNETGESVLWVNINDTINETARVSSLDDIANIRFCNTWSEHHSCVTTYVVPSFPRNCQSKSVFDKVWANTCTNSSSCR